MFTGNYIFSLDDLLIRIREAESLQAQLLELLTSDDKPLRNAFVLRWAIVSDEVTQLMLLVEEKMPEEQVLQIKQMVNNYHPGCWEDYHNHGGRLIRLYGNEEKSV